jgi:uncharacterized phage protein gp47/JayE
MTPEELLAQFETQDYSYFLNQLLNRVPDTLDKREGSVIYDAIAPAAYAMAELNMQVHDMLLNAYTQTASGEFLDYKAQERGVSRNQATYARGTATFTSDTGGAFLPAIGDRFATIGAEPVFFSVSELLDENSAELTSETAGNAGNVYTGQILPVTPQNGLGTAALNEITVPARDEETDDDLRERLLEQQELVAFGGNVADYLQFTDALEGVGSCRVYPAPVQDGESNTVNVVITNEQRLVPSQQLASEVKEALDPAMNPDGTYDGAGYGIAPIGHKVTVYRATAWSVGVNVGVTVDASTTPEDVTPDIQAAINDYFETVRSTWGKLEPDGMSYAVRIYRAQILAKLILIPGILNATVDLVTTQWSGFDPTDPQYNPALSITPDIEIVTPWWNASSQLLPIVGEVVVSEL